MEVEFRRQFLGTWLGHHTLQRFWRQPLPLRCTPAEPASSSRNYESPEPSSPPRAAFPRRPSRSAWLAAVVLPLSAFAAFVWSRTVGLPQGADDIGNWWEPLGLSSLFVEACVAAVAVHVLAPARRRAPVRVGLRAAEGALR